MRLHRPIVIALTLSLVAAACGGGSDDTTDATGDEARGEGWTVLHYTIADTDLEPFLMADLEEMGEVGSGENLDIVAMVDRAADYSADPVLGLDDWQGAKVLEINAGGAEVVEELGDVNTGDPTPLSDFVTRGIEDHPAGHYALILSDHGASWPGVGGDESAEHDVLDLAEIRSAVATGLEDAGVDKLDLLGFDACLMATYEVASAMAPLADRMVASQELEPGHGWDYRRLQLLADAPDTTADELGSALIEGFAGQAAEQGTDPAITLALVDLTQMGAVDEALGEFTTALVEQSAAVAPVIGRARPSILGFGRSPDPVEDTHMADLGLLASQIGTDAPDVSAQADAVVQALDEAVVDSVDGAATQGATGLSIYFPPDASLFSPDYEAASTAGGWNDFLTSFYEAGAAIPPTEQARFVDPDEGAEVFFDEDGVNIAGTFDLAAQDNLAEATISYGLVGEDGSVTFIGEEPAAIADDGSGQALGIYDLTTLTVSDGEDTAFAYLDLTIDEESGVATIDVPMAYYAPEDVEGETYQDVLLSLSLDVETVDILNETYYAYDDTLGTYGELTAEPDGLILPEVLVVDADGTQTWAPTTDVGLFADLPDIVYDLEDLEPGTELYLELTVTDYGGNSDTLSATVTVP